jgi:hypothetical protein
MSKVKELLNKLDAEMLVETDRIIAEKDGEIKAAGQAAYDAAVQSAINDIKAAVEVRYSTARSYLEQLVETESAIDGGETDV